MSRRIIYKPNAPSVVRHWDPRTDDAVAGYHLAGAAAAPVIVGVLTAAVSALTFYLAVPGNQEGVVEWLMAFVPVLYVVAYVSYQFWRNTYVEARTDDDDLVIFDQKFRRLPLHLQAEGAALRASALRFSDDGNVKGMEACRKALNELTGANVHRTVMRQDREVQEATEVGEAMEAAMQYRQETTAMYAGELGTRSEPEPDEDDIVLEGDILPPKPRPFPQQREGWSE